MRKLVLYTLLSLDGVAESPERYVFDFDDEMYANLTRVIEAQDAVLLGRRTYDAWASYWPTSKLFTDEDNLLKLKLLRAVGAPSGALLVDYRVLNHA